MLPEEGWLDRPCPRRSCATTRKPCCEEEHLPVPGVGVQRPAVREHHGRALAPVLVVDLGAVLGGDGAHGFLPSRPLYRVAVTPQRPALLGRRQIRSRSSDRGTTGLPHEPVAGRSKALDAPYLLPHPVNDHHVSTAFRTRVGATARPRVGPKVTRAPERSSSLPLRTRGNAPVPSRPAGPPGELAPTSRDPHGERFAHRAARFPDWFGPVPGIERTGVPGWGA